MSGTNDRDVIRGWLEQEFAIVEEAGSVSIVGLVHHAHSGPNNIHSMKTGHSKWGDATAMAATFDAMAERHAKGIAGGGAQQFELQLCRGDKGVPTTVLPFVRVGSSSIMGPSGSLATEPPTPIGQVQQSMRMGEIVVQGMTGHIGSMYRAQGELVDRLMRRLAEVDHECRELWIACKDLLLEFNKRKHSEKMSELSAARLAEFQRQAMTLAPALINMMAGNEVFPLNAADTSILDTIAAFASAEDLRLITAGLAAKPGGPEIAATLTDRFDKYHKRKAAEAAEEKRLIEGLPDRTYEEAERDAAGEAIRALRGPVDAPQPKTLNGNTNGSLEAAKATAEQVFIRGLFEGANEAQVEVMAKLYESQGRTDLAHEILVRYRALKSG
jgi:hypothetical protein